MELNEITSILIKLNNEDESTKLEFLKSVLDYYHKSGTPQFRELIYKEFNRLSEEINEEIIKEKEE